MKTNVTTIDLTLLATRLILAFVTAAHGVQKLFGWFGGYGFEGTMGFFTETIGLPYVFGALIIIAETIGMIALALGLFGRVLSGSVIIIMLGAILTFHGTNGFYMNWDGIISGEGFEFHILAIGLALPVLLQGSGYFSLDYYFFKRKKSGEKETIPDYAKA